MTPISFPVNARHFPLKVVLRIKFDFTRLAVQQLECDLRLDRWPARLLNYFFRPLPSTISKHANLLPDLGLEQLENRDLACIVPKFMYELEIFSYFDCDNWLFRKAESFEHHHWRFVSNSMECWISDFHVCVFVVVVITTQLWFAFDILVENIVSVLKISVKDWPIEVVRIWLLSIKREFTNWHVVWSDDLET